MPDFNKSFDSVEELERVLEEEFSESEEEKEDVEETVDEVEETVDEVDEQHSEEKDKEDVDVDENEEEETLDDLKEKKVVSDEDVKKVEKTSKVDKSDKTDYTFKKFREENTELKQKLSKHEQEIKTWEDIAKSYGYQNAEEMAKTIKARKIEEEAKAKNIDPEVYKRLQELEERAMIAEKEKQEQSFNFKKQQFVETFNSFTKENELSDEERTKIVQNLEEEGWDFDSLINVKNPKRLLQGYAVDILSERKTQRVLETEKKSLKEKKFTSTSSGEKSIDDIVKEDLKKYATERGIKL